MTYERFQPYIDSIQEESGNSEPTVVEEQEPVRLQRKRKPPQQPKRLRWLRIGAIVLVCVIAFYALPIPLGHIQVTGSDKVTAEDIIVSGQISEPVNIVKINTEKLKTRLSKDLRIESVSISYELPATMVVHVTERKGVAIVPYQFGYLTLDKNGVVIDANSVIEDTSIPIMSGVASGNFLLGDTVKDSAILAGLTYLNDLDANTFKDIAEINVGDIHNLFAYTVDGVQVRLGDDSDLQQKAELSASMIKDVKQNKVQVQYIEVNLASPYIKTQQ